MSKWQYGVFKETLKPFEPGDRVVIGESSIQFTHPTIGKGFWILSLTDERILLIADGDPSIGTGLKRLIRREASIVRYISYRNLGLNQHALVDGICRALMITASSPMN